MEIHMKNVEKCPFDQMFYLSNLFITGIGVNCIEQGKTRRKLLSSTGNFYFITYLQNVKIERIWQTA